MDQDNTKGQDKRNWRERLGIGAQGNKELSKISDDFRKEPATAAARPAANAKPGVRPAASAAAPVKPAPMAPRAVSRATPQAPVSPDKLAERLRSQREASTKLAEQRVQVAKQRADTQNAAPSPPPVQASQTVKPKFTFAEDGGEAKPSAAPTKPAGTAPPVQSAPTSAQPQLSPARPPLGGTVPPLSAGFPQQRPPTPAYQAPPVPGFPQAGQLPPGYPPSYGQQPVPPYRPIDPSTGYAPPPGYVPQQRGFGVPPQQGGYTPSSGPRLNLPPRPEAQRPLPGMNPNYQPQPEYGAPPSAGPGGFAPQARMNRPPLRAPVPPPEQDPAYEDEFYDDLPPQRGGRPTSTDYQQAYREAEYGYEDEAPRSKAPWILAGLLLLALLVAGLGVWGYQSFWKPAITGQGTTQEVPAVTAPESPAKVQAEQPAAQQPAAATPTKKQIYDRIVGDQEILGGDVSAPSETPAAIPEPSTTIDTAPQPSSGGGEDATPLPIPPPPGGTGDQQGSLDPGSEKQSAENITPAAGESQAAVAAQTDLALPSAAAAPVPGDAPVPGEVSSVQSGSRSIVPDVPAPEPQSEAIADEPVAQSEKKKAAVAEKKKVVTNKEKVATTKLGAKPVVLVAPSKKARTAASQTLDDTQVASGSEVADGGLYDDANNVAPAPKLPEAAASPAPKKKRTLADLFSNSKDEAETDAVDVASVEKPAAKPAQKKPTTPVVTQGEQATGGAGFVVQLASFRSRAEATTEYGRLKSKHSGTLGQFSPIITEATVGGSTRYRLSVGSMASQAQANSVCSSLFAAGERDCLVKKR